MKHFPLVLLQEGLGGGGHATTVIWHLLGELPESLPVSTWKAAWEEMPVSKVGVGVP